VRRSHLAWRIEAGAAATAAWLTHSERLRFAAAAARSTRLRSPGVNRAAITLDRIANALRFWATLLAIVASPVWDRKRKRDTCKMYLGMKPRQYVKRKHFGKWIL
jgi:hypothetical protein